MATFFRTAVIPNIGTTPVEVLSVAGGNRFTVVGCNFANTTDYSVIIDIKIVNSALVEAYYIKQLVIDPYTSAKVVTNGEKIILQESCKMVVTCDTANSVDAVISYAEIV